MNRLRTLAARPAPQRQQQLSLPFMAANPTIPLIEAAQHAAIVTLLRQMLIDGVLAELSKRATDNKKETADE